MRSSYTRGEKLRLAYLVVKAAKQSFAGDRNVDTIDPRVKAEAVRIEERAAERGEREAQALREQLAKTRSDAASAKAAMRASRGSARAEARREMHAHEAAARRLERELNTYR
ncbi:DUF6257 family protein [Streptomyces sp. STR69]|uniref:DUF6257 family protein n=1 Tax=Streptomyces sp. STR69 TaxID=1796942 RepID=UPI0021C9F3D6|nr:DUF6257 family protein [Streptomyces sp. STR69]